MQNEWWMRPALQKSEAVLLPALPRRLGTTRLLNSFVNCQNISAPFIPIEEVPQKPSTELSTWVRPRGSMAGRSVLRAAGVCAEPYMIHPVRRKRW